MSISKPSFTGRQKAVRAHLALLNADAMLVTNLPDVRYLCGFNGSNAALAISAGKSVLFTDGRYTAQAAKETTSAKVHIVSGSAAMAAILFLGKQGSRQCFLDPATTTIADLEQWGQSARDAGLQLVSAGASPVLQLRQRKDAYELGCLRRAAALGCELYYDILRHIVPGVTETSIAARLEHTTRERGAEKMAFDTIVASGIRSALPHGRATLARLPRRGFVTLDFGVILNGYCSDMTRTVYLGTPTAAHLSAYEAVLAAQQAGVAAVRAGVPCGHVDEAARRVLRQAKLDAWFTHSTGHGVGLEIHEPPRVAANQQQVLAEGMVITIEPGIYIPGKFGIRIEDTVAVTRTGCEVLTPAPKGFTVLA